MLAIDSTEEIIIGDYHCRIVYDGDLWIADVHDDYGRLLFCLKGTGEAIKTIEAYMQS